MRGQARHDLALAHLEHELNVAVAEDSSSAIKAKLVSDFLSGSIHQHEPHSGHHAHAAIEITHHFLMGVAPFQIVAAQVCTPANDHMPSKSMVARLEDQTVSHQGVDSFEAIKYLPGPLQQAAIQLFTSIALSCAPAFAQWRERRSQASSAPEVSNYSLRASVASALRANAPGIGTDVALAGLSDLAVEVVGWLMKEARTVYCRLVRALRHSMFPAIKAIKVLMFNEPGLTARESADLALKLFVQAGIIGIFIAAEQHLHHMLGHVFGQYAGIISTVCMSVLCWYACTRAIAELDKIDPLGAKKERVIKEKIATLRRQWAEGDRSTQALLHEARYAGRLAEM